MRSPANDARPSSEDDERLLIALLRSGDAAAFETLFRANAAAMCDLAFSYVQSRDTAEEIVQDIFTWVWVHRHAFLPPHGLRPYLFGAVRNRCLNALRDATTESRAVDRMSLRPSRSPDAADADLMADALDEVVRTTVAAMPARCREVFTLIRSQALSYAEVAAVLGIAPKTVEVHMTRALAILRARLGPWLDG